MPVPRLLGLALLAGCSDGNDDDSTPSPPTCPTDLTWSNYADGWFTTWCTGCHSSSLTGEDRGNAPLGVDFDTLDGVKAHSETIADRTYGDLSSGPLRMPPAGSADDVDLLEEWITCGMPGEDPDPPFTAKCASPVSIPGPVSVSSGSPCTGQEIAITGDLALESDADVSCVCDVTGSVVIDAGATHVSLPSLRTVGVDLTTSLTSGLASLSLPALASVGGSLRFEGIGVVETFTLPELVSVGGDFVVSGSDHLVTFSPPKLETVGGTLAIQDLPALVDVVNFTGVKGIVGGDVTITDVPLYTGPFYGGWSSLLRVEEVVGSITLERTGFREMAGFQETTKVGGSVIIRDNPSLGSISGFFELAEVGTRFEISDNPALVQLSALGSLRTVGAAPGAEYPEAGLFLVDLPALTLQDAMDRPQSVFLGIDTLDAFELVECDALTELFGFGNQQLRGLPGALRIVGNDSLTTTVQAGNPARASFGSVASIGTLEIVDNPALDWFALPDLAETGSFTVSGNDVASIDDVWTPTHVFHFGALLTVDGDLSIDGNPGLTTVEGLGTVQSVTGSLAVTDNPALSTGEAQAFADGVTVGGAVVISGNGP